MADTRKPELRSHDRLLVTSIYFVVSCVMTWPLATGLTTDVPADLGDSLLNMWILGWNAENVPRLLTGQIAIREFWNANIFHPAPLTLALSETLFGQSLQILPVYHLTGNLLLCYNLLFLSTFVLSGLGMYLLVREFTGNRFAAFLAGLLFAFVPVRIGQFSHIQTISSQWMPFAMYGFRRYVITGRWRALIGGALALVMQNLSNGYFLIYFAPVIVLFVLHQIITSVRRGDWRMWAAFAMAALLVAVGTVPVLALYWQGRDIYGLERPFEEVANFSADVYSYFTASEGMRFASRLRLHPKPEGDLFLGAVAMSLAATAVIATVHRARRLTVGSTTWFRVLGPRTVSLRSLATIITSTAAVVLLLGLVAIILTGGFVTTIAGIQFRANNAPRIFAELLVAIAALTALSGKFRSVLVRVMTSPVGLATTLLLFTVWMSLGPLPQVGGRIVDDVSLYGMFMEHVPGFAGLRVPARYAMIAAVFLTWLAGHGADRVLGRLRSTSGRTVATAALAGVFLVEAWFAPMSVNQTWGEQGVVPPARVEPPDRAPDVYRFAKTLPRDAVLVEFPFGDHAWELRYVYYSTVHWKRIVNGYSGQFPSRYSTLVARMNQLQRDPEAAWRELQAAGPTHAIVHEGAMAAADARQVEAWLETHAFRAIGRFGQDVLFAR